MPITIAGRRLWRTAEGGLVEDGDPAARTLAYGPADEIEGDDFKRLPKSALPKREPTPKAPEPKGDGEPDAKADAGAQGEPDPKPEPKADDAGGEGDDGKPKGGSIMARRGRPPKPAEK